MADVRQAFFPQAEECGRRSGFQRERLGGQPCELRAQAGDREVHEGAHLGNRHAPLRHEKVDRHGRGFGIPQQKLQRPVMDALGHVIGVEPSQLFP